MKSGVNGEVGFFGGFVWVIWWRLEFCLGREFVGGGSYLAFVEGGGSCWMFFSCWDFEVWVVLLALMMVSSSIFVLCFVEWWRGFVGEYFEIGGWWFCRRYIFVGFIWGVCARFFLDWRGVFAHVWSC